MKLIAVLLAMVITSFTGFSGLHAQERGKEKGRGGTVKKIEAEGRGVHDWMASFWAKISKIGKKGPSNIPTSVAGLRGVEQEKGKELTPYWKGKEANKDSASMAKVETLINKKDFGAAKEELKSFKQLYPDSPLTSLASCSPTTASVALANLDSGILDSGIFLRDYPD